MTLREYRWHDGAADHVVELAWVPGRGDAPYPMRRSSVRTDSLNGLKRSCI